MICILLILLITPALTPITSQAAVTPYFVLVNETLLPFSESTMPFIVGGEMFVPVLPINVFRELGVWAVGSDDFVRLFRGDRYVDFYTTPGDARTTNHDGLILRWPHARSVGGRFYVPLRQVSDFFGLTFQIVEIPDSIIPERPMQAVRIISHSAINGPTAVGMNRDGIRSAFEERFVPPQTLPGPPVVGDPPSPLPPVEPELPPDYSDVTIYLSFFDLSGGSAEQILDLLDTESAAHVRACFFVNSEDVFSDPGLIRRISGTGHTLGIWLEEGTFEEYLKISAILFEAAKVRTVIISASDATEQARETAQAHQLIFWDSAGSVIDDEAPSVSDITATLPRESGARHNLLFLCNEQTTSVLPGVYAYLRTNRFTIEKITETVALLLDPQNDE